jgi:hypothetical protein
MEATIVGRVAAGTGGRTRRSGVVWLCEIRQFLAPIDGNNEFNLDHVASLSLRCL